ncbi:MAG: serpin family protein [Anaerolineae bacterium]|jgi:serpin B
MDLDPIVSANTRFGFKLLAQLARENAGKNLFISPASISIALTMVYSGAGGRTQAALAGTLELEGMSLDEINQASAVLMKALQSADPQVRLVIANALWAAKDVAFRPAFTRRLQEAYDAQVAEVDLSDPATLQLINDWVKTQTEGKIDSILSKLDPVTLLILVNAIYYKGRWTRPFDEENTRDGPFTLLDGSRKIVPMMSQSGSYRVYRGSDFQAVRLPYGEKRTAMYVFLPDRSSSLDEFQKRLTAENWNEWMSRFHHMEGSIVLPRFRLEYEKQLNETLMALGMGIAFGRGADFSAMCDTPAYISEVVHKTFVEVNEEGTEAAAATAVVMVRSMLMPQETFRMVVDRPFFCAIRDERTGALLFMGSVVEPR